MEQRALPAISPDQTIELIFEALRELVDYELAVVLGLEGPGRLRVRKAEGRLYTPELEGLTISLSEHQELAAALASRAPVLFDRGEYRVDTYREVLDLPQGHSCLAAPLFFGADAIGLLTLDHRACGAFTPATVKVIASLAKLMSVALSQSEAALRLARQNEGLLAQRNRLLGPDAEAFRDLVGVSPAWRAVLDAILLVAASEAPVLLLGETGTGKELAAKTLHRLSRRADSPFIAVNCSALAPSLAESELFGHERGAFTGAMGQHRGRFELAEGGTLFLDEIGDLPIPLQPKLLRILQDGVFERVGGERPIKVDVRVIAATNVDLEAAVSRGAFREDLLYRLEVFPIRLPSLRERDHDVLMLAEHFLSMIRTRSGYREISFGKSALEAMLAHGWPGNARELRNAVERAAILSRGGRIEAEHLVLRPSKSCAEAAPREDASPGARSGRAFPSMEEAQRAHIKEALATCAGKIYGAGGAAELLGLKPSTLQGKMARLGIPRG